MESQRYGASSAIWDHTVLPATRHLWVLFSVTLFFYELLCHITWFVMK